MPRIPREGSEPEDQQTTDTTEDVRADDVTEPEAKSSVRSRVDEATGDSDSETKEQSRVSVVNESAPGPDDEEYKWHTGAQRPHGAEDAIEFVDVHKAFGRNKILRGLNMGLPEDRISMILGPSVTGKSVCIKHMVGLLYPDEGDVLVHGESVPNMQDDELFEMRKKFGVLFQDGALFGSMNLYDNVAFPLRQHT